MGARTANHVSIPKAKNRKGSPKPHKAFVPSLFALCSNAILLASSKYGTKGEGETRLSSSYQIRGLDGQIRSARAPDLIIDRKYTGH